MKNITKNFTKNNEEVFEFEKTQKNIPIENISIFSKHHLHNVEPHSHHFFEFVYILQGTAEHTLNGVTETIRAGDYFFVDYGTIHSYETKDLLLVNCPFLPEMVDEVLSGCQSFEELIRICLIRYHKRYFESIPANRSFQDDSGQVRQLVDTMCLEFQEQQVGYTEILKCHLKELMVHTMRKVIKSNHSHKKRTTQNTAVLNTIKYIEQNYRNKAVLTEFCATFHYSPQYISRLFKQHTGITPHEYLHKVRIEKSCELLVGSDMQIQEIAQLVGYEDAKFFSTIFRRMLKISPKEYRNCVQLP